MYGQTGDVYQTIIFATNLYFAKFIALEIIALGMPKITRCIRIATYVWIIRIYMCVSDG